MTRSLHAIADETAQALQAAGVPIDAVLRVQSFLMATLEPFERARQAAELMPKLGADRAAQVIGCHRSTVYRMARRKSQKHGEFATEDG